MSVTDLLGCCRRPSGVTNRVIIIIQTTKYSVIQSLCINDLQRSTSACIHFLSLHHISELPPQTEQMASESSKYVCLILCPDSPDVHLMHLD